MISKKRVFEGEPEAEQDLAQNQETEDVSDLFRQLNNAIETKDDIIRGQYDMLAELQDGIKSRSDIIREQQDIIAGYKKSLDYNKHKLAEYAQKSKAIAKQLLNIGNSVSYLPSNFQEILANLTDIAPQLQPFCDVFEAFFSLISNSSEKKVVLTIFSHGSIMLKEDRDIETFQMPENLTMKYVSFSKPGYICSVSQFNKQQLFEIIKANSGIYINNITQSIDPKFLRRLNNVFEFNEKEYNQYNSSDEERQHLSDKFYELGNQFGFTREFNVYPGQIMGNYEYQKFHGVNDFLLFADGYHEPIDITILLFNLLPIMEHYNNNEIDQLKQYSLKNNNEVTLESIITLFTEFEVKEIFLFSTSCAGFVHDGVPVDDPEIIQQIIEKSSASGVIYGGRKTKKRHAKLRKQKPKSKRNFKKQSRRMNKMK